MPSTYSVPALMAWTVVFCVGAYAVCGIPFGLIIARSMGHIDVRSTGSGNIGTTNVARSVGKAAAGLTLLCDLGKGLLSMLFARFMLSLVVFGEAGFSPSLAGGEGLVSMSAVFAACVLGHIFSPYLDFHGGKGIAVGLGAALGLWWPVGLGLIVVFAAFAVPSRYVSLGSVLAAVSLPIQCAAWGFGPWATAFVAAAALVVVWAHRSNITKLVHGKENKFAFHKDEAAKDNPDVNKPAPQETESRTDAADVSDRDDVDDGGKKAPSATTGAHAKASAEDGETEARGKHYAQKGEK